MFFNFIILRCDHFMYSKKTSFFNMFHVYCFCVKCTWWFFLIIIHFGMYFIYDRFFVSVQYQIYLSLLVTVLGFWNRYIIYVRNFAFQWILYVQCDSFLIQVFERLFYFDTVYILHDLRDGRTDVSFFTVLWMLDISNLTV